MFVNTREHLFTKQMLYNIYYTIANTIQQTLRNKRRTTTAPARLYNITYYAIYISSSYKTVQAANVIQSRT